MRICVISDVHSNLPALEAVLEALAPYDELWHLGDIVGYGPQPNEVIARLRAENAHGVRGNHDSAAVGLISTEAFNEEAARAIDWTQDELDDASRTWLSGLPELTERHGFTLAHGSPRDPTWEYVFSSGTARGNLAAFSTDHCLIGHTHVPLAFCSRDGSLQTCLPNGPLEITGSRSLLNPGSVGQPRDGDRRASAMLIDAEAGVVTWQRTEYDIGRVQKLIRQTGLSPRSAHRLALGL
jgi:predicted phosphodiesterase